MAPPGFPASAPVPVVHVTRGGWHPGAPASVLHKVDAVPRTAVYVRNVIPRPLSAIFLPGRAGARTAGLPGRGLRSRTIADGPGHPGAGPGALPSRTAQVTRAPARGALPLRAAEPPG